MTQLAPAVQLVGVSRDNDFETTLQNERRYKAARVFSVEDRGWLLWHPERGCAFEPADLLDYLRITSTIEKLSEKATLSTTL